ncbi:MAG: hypothetical protein GY928_40585 [Colwellia sp.]|nr:hypothetical protein [Colwellia sp.]
MEGVKEPRWDIGTITGVVFTLLEKAGVIAGAVGIGGKQLSFIFEIGGPFKMTGIIVGSIGGGAIGYALFRTPGTLILGYYGSLYLGKAGSYFDSIFFPEAGIAYGNRL